MIPGKLYVAQISYIARDFENNKSFMIHKGEILLFLAWEKDIKSMCKAKFIKNNKIFYDTFGSLDVCYYLMEIKHVKKTS